MKLSFNRFGVVALVLQAVLYAQSNPAGVPAGADSSEQQRFEVATIKAVDPSTPHMMGIKIYPGGRVVASGLSLKDLIVAAFGIPYRQISGGDKWVENETYVVEARPQAAMSSRVKTLRYTLFGIEDEYLRELLQTLLIDRFGLRFHRGSTTGHVFELRRSGGLLHLNEDAAAQETGEESTALFGSIGFAAGRWVLANTSMSQLVKFASANIVHAPVVDRTGLTGYFTYKQPVGFYGPEADYRDNSPSFMNLLKEVGLKLDGGEGQIEMFVIDTATRPSPN